MYVIFKQIAFIQQYYKMSLIYDNMLNYITLEIVNKSGIPTIYRVDLNNKDQVKQLSENLRWYTKPAPGATNRSISLNYELKQAANNL